MIDFLISFLLTPGLLLGGLVGLVLALGVHWLFPGTNQVVGALILVAGCIGGALIGASTTGRAKH